MSDSNTANLSLAGKRKRALTVFLSDPADPVKQKSIDDDGATDAGVSTTAAGSKSVGAESISSRTSDIDVEGDAEPAVNAEPPGVHREPNKWEDVVDSTIYDLGLGAPTTPLLPPDGSRPDESRRGQIDNIMQSIGKGVATLTAESLKTLEKEMSVVQALEPKENIETASLEGLRAVDTKKLAAMESATKAGKIKSTSYLAQQFRDKHAKGTECGNTYHAFPTRVEQDAFKMEWLQLELKEFKEQKIHTKSWKRVDHQKGNYMTIEQLEIDQGTSEDARQGVFNLVQMCTAMGSPWILRHPQTKRLLFLKLLFGFEEEFTNAWEHCKQEHTQGWNEESVVTGPAAKAQAKASSAKAKALGDAPKNIGAAPKAKAKAKTATAFDKVFKDALVVKALCLKVSSDSLELAEQIPLEDKWAWARNDQNLGQLIKETKKMRGKFEPFHRQFLTEDGSLIKKQFGEQHITENIKTFIALKPQFMKLQDTITTMKRRCAQ
jgi:hypothetical protein